MRRRVGISASSPSAAKAGAEIADRGGNAVDAAVAASLASLCTDVAFVSPGANGFVAVWPPDGEPVVLDAYAEVPGRGLEPAPKRGPGRKVRLADTSGATTYVGYESVATPGGLAGLAAASEEHGQLRWKELFQPAIRLLDQGIPITPAGEGFFRVAAETIFSWHPEASRLLHHEDGTHLTSGDVITIPALVESARLIADEGVQHLYGGELGRRIAADVVAHGGRLTAADLAEYEVIPRTPLRVRVGDWELALNPPPAVGGVMVGAILLALEADPPKEWSPSVTKRFVEAQHRALELRADLMSGDEASMEAARRLIETLGATPRLGGVGSPSTIHASAVDTDGLACAVTLSDGYGSGAMAKGTGILLNNALGEIELLPPDAPLPPPGTRLVSNMAPTVARRSDGAALAIGSPGADRITSAVAHVLTSFVHQGVPLHETVDLPRVHVDLSEGEPVVRFERGAALESVAGFTLEELPHRDMYFGSAQTVAWEPRTGLAGTADPRRDAAYAEGGA